MARGYAKSVLVRVVEPNTEALDIEIPEIKDYFPPVQIRPLAKVAAEVP